jgi:hypothetical protein
LPCRKLIYFPLLPSGKIKKEAQQRLKRCVLVMPNKESLTNSMHILNTTYLGLGREEDDPRGLGEEHRTPPTSRT